MWVHLLKRNGPTILFSSAFPYSIKHLHNTHCVSIHIWLMNVLHIIVWDYLLWFIISEWKSSAWHSISQNLSPQQCLVSTLQEDNEGRNSFYIEWLVFLYQSASLFSYDVYSIYALMQMNISSLCILHASVVLCFLEIL